MDDRVIDLTPHRVNIRHFRWNKKQNGGDGGNIKERGSEGDAIKQKTKPTKPTG